MYSKFVVIFALVVASIQAAPGYHEPSVHASVFGSKTSLPQSTKAIIPQHTVPMVQSAPVVAHAVAPHEYHGHPKYEFVYGIEDHHTGDIHSQKEVRDGDKVQGEYSLHEADGSIRIVKYTVDKYNGFNAEVMHLQPSKSPLPVKV
ncbi:cuticle protein 7-like [Anoplophora glabripennis]|uniref:cuticle protein 7-like n=1 Tax=Anoplophora glabripennis TaxID=217634 RepID=UPI000875603F|nr:cuticle protein 7-like [Anoplophora glabripennis]